MPWYLGHQYYLITLCGKVNLQSYRNLEAHHHSPTLALQLIHVAGLQLFVGPPIISSILQMMLPLLLEQPALVLSAH